MKKLLLLLSCTLLLLGSGCSLRKSTVSMQSTSEESTTEETHTTVRDTVVVFDGSSMSAQISQSELKAGQDKTFHFSTPQGEIILTLKDSTLIAEAIWKAQQKKISIPETSTKKTDTKKSSSDTKNEEKKSGGNTFWLYIIIAALTVIIYLLIRYKK